MKERVIKIFIFGLNQVGKTTIVEYFRERKFIPQSPTIGVSISRLIFSRLVLDITDVGGQELFRREWTSYLKKPHVLMFVIDGTDRITSRIRQGRQELDRILGIPRISGVPLLVLINKSDAALSMSKRAAMGKYQLQSIKDRQVAIYEVSAKTGVNMDAALNALTSMVLKDDAIEYFVNEEVRKQSRRLLTSFNEFMKKGTSAFKKKEYFEAIASLNIAKELYSNLFQLGVVESGKSYQKLVSMIAEAERESSSMVEDEVHAGKAPVGTGVAGDTGGGKGGKQSWLEHLRGQGMTGDTVASSTATDDARGIVSTRPPTKSNAITIANMFLFGLDRAGKTTLVEYLKSETFKDHAPTLGVNVAHIVLGNVRFEFNDLGGQAAFRNTWMDYWNDPDLMVFMVDATDVGRFKEARDALFSIINLPKTRGVPLLILSNKIDDPEARSAAMMEIALDINSIKDRTVAFYEISIKEGRNVEKALNFMASFILQDDAMESFVSNELKRITRSYKEMFKAYIKEAKILEKQGEYRKAEDRVHRAIFVQEELFKQGFSKARKHIKKCENMLQHLGKR